MTTIRTLVITFVLFLTVSALPQATDDYESAVAQAIAFLQQGDTISALAATQRAIQLNGSDFRARYYSAYALYKRDMLSEAAEHAATALQLAPPESRADVEKLTKAIEIRRRSQEIIAAADVSYGDGLMAKAAAQYAEAWEADRAGNAAAGVKAAEIWANLGEFERAVPVLEHISKHADDEATRLRATELIATVFPAAQAKYNEKFSSGLELFRAGNLPAAAAEFDAASAIDSRRTEALEYLVRIAATNRNNQLVMDRLREVARRGKVDVASLLEEDAFAWLLRDEAFISFLGDAFGQPAIRHVSMLNETRSAISEPKTRVRAAVIRDLLRTYPGNATLKTALERAETELAAQRQQGQRLKQSAGEQAEARKRSDASSAFESFSSSVPLEVTIPRRRPLTVRQSVSRSCESCAIRTNMNISEGEKLLGSEASEFNLGDVSESTAGVTVLRPRERFAEREYLPPGAYLLVKTPTNVARLYFSSEEAARHAESSLRAAKEATLPDMRTIAADVLGLTFYEFSGSFPPVAERIYETSFRNRLLQSIAAEVRLSFRGQVPATSFDLHLTCRHADGTSVVDQAFTFQTRPGSNDMLYSFPMSRDTWRLGRYDVTISGEGKTLVTGSFTVTD